MLPPNDAMMEPIRNSIQVVKDAISPLQLGIQKAAKDFESCWGGLEIISNDVDRNRGKRVYPVDELSCAIDSKNCSTKEQICYAKKTSVGDGGDCVMSGEGKKKALSVKVPFRTFLGMFSLNLDHFDNSRVHNKVEVDKKGLKESDSKNKDGTCVNCLQFALTCSLLVNGFVRAFPNPFKNNKKLVEKVCDHDQRHVHLGNRELKAKERRLTEKEGRWKVDCDRAFQAGNCDDREGKNVSIECLIGLMFEQLVHNLQEFDQRLKESNGIENDRDTGWSSPPLSTALFDNLRAVMGVWEDRKVDINGFLGNLSFAKVGGLPSSVVGVSSSANEEGDNDVNSGGGEESGSSSAQKLVSGILGIPLSNVERLKSTLSTISLSELVELVPYLGRTSKDHPDKKKLISVQDFFRYTELEGRRFFEELDRDGDGQVTMEDLEIAMRKRKLPRRYAREFMHRARSHLFSKSFGWKQFLSLMEQREPTILRAYTSLCLSKSGTLQESEILASLKNAGLPSNEENAVAMMRFLKADTEESISYGHFRNFMLLLPSDRLQDDPRSIWFEAATVVPVAPPVEIPAGSVLRSALAGGLSCALSCCLLHPVDTIKTRVQASTLTFPEIISKLPQIGVRALYRGSIPAIWGQFTSHGLRTGVFEASKLLLVNVVPNLPELQVQSAASFCSTFLGTAVRIPCEVLKQRLQAGLFDNVGEAIVGTWHQDGVRGFFRGTGATLCREVPFYVAGMGLYAESKKVVQQILKRELEPWETIMVGAISGGLAAIVTTPFDVMKTRMMTAPQGRPVSMAMVAFSIVRHEGPLGLFKGAIPRFFWIAPLGAMNFAGYELARKAMERNEEPLVDQQPQKKLTTTG